MYLQHFNITEPPFALTPNTDFYCNLPGSQMALNVLMFGIQSGEGFIKIIGEVGSGKTLLCRKLLNSLDDHVHTAYIPNPDLSPAGLRRMLAQELGVDAHSRISSQDALTLITKRLLELKASGKNVVLIIDEAQALPDESLEALRLLTNLETEKEKLLQIVLFGQPELDDRLNRYQFRQLKQRITFSYYLQPVKWAELNNYICHRLAIAGYTQGSIFSSRAMRLLFRRSHGMPRLINVLCHKALLAAYGRGEKIVSYKSMLQAVRDTESIEKEGWFRRYWFFAISLFVLLAIGVVYYHYGLVTLLDLR